jgi:molybdate transport system substrate-binding protein
MEDIMRAFWSILTLSSSLLAASVDANAAEIKLLSPVAMRAVMPEITGQFERASGHKVTVEFATAGAIASRLMKGDAADVAIVSDRQMDELEGHGKIATGGRKPIAKVGLGVFVRAGSAKPEMASVDNFKTMLLKVKTVGYGDPAKGGVSGVHMAKLVERLGVASEINVKTSLFADSQAVMKAVADGSAEIGIGLTSDQVLVQGIQLAGGFPAEIQNFTDYAAAGTAASKDAAASAALVGFLASPAAKTAFKDKGFEPR